MKKFLILILALLSILSLHAQGWQPFLKGEKYNYSKGNKQFYATIWIDSSTFINNDSVYFFNKVLQKVKTGPNWQYPNFYLNDQSQFFLSKLSFSENRELQFTENDTIKFLFKPLANLNEQWVFDSVKNIIATVVSEDEAVIFGETDSIKMLTLSNSDTIIVSKFHSFLKFPLFDTLNQHVLLAGIEGRNLGIQVPEFNDFFNFAPTDVFCYASEWTTGSEHFYTGLLEKYTVLSKTISNDSIIYHCSYKNVRNHYDYLSIPPWNTKYTVNPDTSFVYIDDLDHFLNKYPKQILNSQLIGGKYKPIIVDFDTNWNTIIKTYPLHNFCKNLYQWTGDTILEQAGPFGCKEEVEKRVYGVNIGLTLSYNYDPNVPYGPGTDYKKILKGYTHNGLQQGIIYHDSIFIKNSQGIDSVEKIFKIYPNPVQDLLSIELDSVREIQALIFNINGQLIINQLFNSDKIIINVNELGSGLYFVKLISGNSIDMLKFIKE